MRVAAILDAREGETPVVRDIAGEVRWRVVLHRITAQPAYAIYAPLRDRAHQRHIREREKRQDPSHGFFTASLSCSARSNVCARSKFGATSSDRRTLCLAPFMSPASRYATARR